MIEIRGGKILQRQWRLRPLYSVNIDPPVKNQWYTIFPITSDCNLAYVSIYPDNSTQDIEIEWMVDGETLTGSDRLAPGACQWYLPTRDDTLDFQRIHTDGEIRALVGGFLPCQSIKIRARVTDTVDADNELVGHIRYLTL